MKKLLYIILLAGLLLGCESVNNIEHPNTQNEERFEVIYEQSLRCRSMYAQIMIDKQTNTKYLLIDNYSVGGVAIIKLEE